LFNLPGIEIVSDFDFFFIHLDVNKFKLELLSFNIPGKVGLKLSGLIEKM